MSDAVDALFEFDQFHQGLHCHVGHLYKPDHRCLCWRHHEYDRLRAPLRKALCQWNIPMKRHKLRVTSQQIVDILACIEWAVMNEIKLNNEHRSTRDALDSLLGAIIDVSKKVDPNDARRAEVDIFIAQVHRAKEAFTK